MSQSTHEHPHKTLPCGGECCGTTHVQRWLWDESDKPEFQERAAYSRAALWAIADHLPDYFRRYDVYWLLHGGLNARLKSRGVPAWDQHRYCPTCKWDAYLVDYLHTNGYLGLLRLHPGGGRAGQYFLTDKALDWLTSQGWRPRLEAAA